MPVKYASYWLQSHLPNVKKDVITTQISELASCSSAFIEMTLAQISTHLFSNLYNETTLAKILGQISSAL